MLKNDFTKFAFILFCLLSPIYIEAQCCQSAAYALNADTEELVSVNTASGDITSITSLSGDLDGTNGFQAGGEMIDCKYYATNGTNIYEVDLATGSSTLVIATGGLPSGELFTGLEVDPTTGLFYASSTDIDQSTLWRLDLVLGTASPIGTLVNSCAISLIIGPDGSAYYIDLCSDEIYPIDLSTGLATGVGLPLGFDLNFGQDYSFDCPVGSNMIFGFAFNNDTFTSQYVSIDPSTGTTTVIQDIGLNQIGSFAFCIGSNQATAPTSIPTMGEWGLISLCLLLLIFGIVNLRQTQSPTIISQ